MHGLTHDRRLFSSRAAFEERLAPLAELAGRLGAVGFRSPATHRVFDWLAELPVEYDSTIPNSDPYEPSPEGAAPSGRSSSATSSSSPTRCLRTTRC